MTSSFTSVSSYKSIFPQQKMEKRRCTNPRPIYSQDLGQAAWYNLLQILFLFLHKEFNVVSSHSTVASWFGAVQTKRCHTDTGLAAGGFICMFYDAVGNRPWHNMKHKIKSNPYKLWGRSICMTRMTTRWFIRSALHNAVQTKKRSAHDFVDGERNFLCCRCVCRADILRGLTFQ